MATNTQIKNNIDSDITNKTSAKSVTNTNVGARIKDVVDYIDQEISTIISPDLSLKENISNKSTSVTNDAISDTKYPSVKAVKTYTDSVVGDAVFDINQELADKENIANKSTNVAVDGTSNTKYPSAKAVKDYTDSLVVGLLDDRGNYDASTNLFPSTGGSGGAGAILKGDLWFISVSGTLGGKSAPVGSSVRALTDAPAQISSNWDILNSGLGFTPENEANKSTDVTIDGSSDIKYPSVKAVKTYVDANAGGEQIAKVLKTQITSAQILQSFTTRIPLLLNDDPTKIKIPIALYIKKNNDGSEYVLTDNEFWIYKDANFLQNIFIQALTVSGFGFAVANTFVNISDSGMSGSLTANNYYLQKTGGNPTSGTATMDAYITYFEITL